MPSAVTKRAEDILMKIVSVTRELQAEVFETQDSLAKKTQKTFQDQKQTIQWSKIPCETGTALIAAVLSFSYNKEAGELAARVGSTVTSFFVEPSQIDQQGKQQKLGSQQTELVTWQQGWTSVIQGVETALQRLQNNESSTRQQ